MKTKVINQVTEKRPFVLNNDRILIVDNDQKWLDVVCRNAEYYGAKEIYQTKSPSKGMYFWEVERPSIIFIDINFNEKDLTNKEGLDLLEQLSYKIQKLPDKKYLEKNPDIDFPTTTLVAISSFKGMRGFAKKAGANYFIRKKNFIRDFEGFVWNYHKVRLV